MKLIPLEEAERMLEEMKKQFAWKDDFQVWVTAWIEASIYRIKAVQTIDPIATIDEMIESFPTWFYNAMNTLERLKEKLSLTQK